MTKQMIRESTDTVEVPKVSSTGPTRALITLITPGEGSSGHYSMETIAQAATDKVFPRGTQMHINHDSELQRMERPEGDLRNLAAVLVEDAKVADDGRLVAEALVASAWSPTISEFKDFIGTSIVAPADIVVESGKRIVAKLYPAKTNRVDFVTIAGRGGRIDEVMESISSRALAMEAWNSDVERALRDAVALASSSRNGEAIGWLVDFDDARVILERYRSDVDRHAFYSVGYSMEGDVAVLDTEHTEVRRRVEYDPINSPAVPAGVQESAKLSEEDNMAKVEIDEAELQTLRESASRATELETALEAERQERKAEADKMAQEALDARSKAAKAIVTEAYGVENTPAFLVTAAESAAQAEDFDADQFRTQVTEAAAAAASASGAGSPRGLGSTPAPLVKESADLSQVPMSDLLNGKA